MAILTRNNNFVRATTSDKSSLNDHAWRSILRQSIRDPVELCRRLQLPPSLVDGSADSHAQFPTFAPLPFVARMIPGKPDDPLLRQVLPLSAESKESSGFTADPVGDRSALSAPGLLQKYDGRALLITTGACAVHCRYCFRRHFPYHERPIGTAQWNQTMDQLRRDQTIEEVLLSGGDPLMLNDSVLESLIGWIDEIGHIRRIRIHTRLPIMIPQRMTAALRKMLERCRTDVVLVVHTNHANEIDQAVWKTLRDIKSCVSMLLNQTVLLKGVNDDADALIELSRRLLDCKTLPYYLHQLDRVRGATHFEVPVARGKELVDRMRGVLPGYAVPRYVQEFAGEPGKTILA